MYVLLFFCNLVYQLFTSYVLMCVCCILIKFTYLLSICLSVLMSSIMFIKTLFYLHLSRNLPLKLIHGLTDGRPFCFLPDMISRIMRTWEGRKQSENECDMEREGRAEGSDGEVRDGGTGVDFSSAVDATGPRETGSVGVAYSEELAPNSNSTHSLLCCWVTYLKIYVHNITF